MCSVNKDSSSSHSLKHEKNDKNHHTDISIYTGNKGLGDEGLLRVQRKQLLNIICMQCEKCSRGNSPIHNSSREIFMVDAILFTVQLFITPPPRFGYITPHCCP